MQSSSAERVQDAMRKRNGETALFLKERSELRLFGKSTFRLGNGVEN